MNKKSSSVSLGLTSLLVWLWWCHCLGHALAESVHAIHLFSTVSFTKKSEELGGFDSTCIFPIYLLPHCCPLLFSCLSHTDSSVCSNLLRSFFTLLLTIMTSSIFILLQCHIPDDDDSSAWSVEKICMWIFIFERERSMRNREQRSKFEQNTFLSGPLFLIIFFPINRQQLICHWILKVIVFFLLCP